MSRFISFTIDEIYAFAHKPKALSLLGIIRHREGHMSEPFQIPQSTYEEITGWPIGTTLWALIKHQKLFLVKKGGNVKGQVDYSLYAWEMPEDHHENDE